MSQSNYRATGFIIFFCLLSLIIFFKLFLFTVIQYDNWADLAHSQVTRQVIVEPLRGRILSSDDQTVLAESEVNVSLAIDTFKIRSTKQDVQISKHLAEILDLPVELVLSNIHSKHCASWVKRDITPAEFQQIQQLQHSGRLPGVCIRREIKRKYPCHPLAATIIGFAIGQHEEGFEPLGTYSNLHGIEGLEYAYNTVLAGRQGRYEYLVNRYSAPDQNSVKILEPLQNGFDLRTTIDIRLQNIVHEELAKALLEEKAVSVMAVIVDPTDGSILASCSIQAASETEDFNSDLPVNCWLPEMRRHLPAFAVFEPGSIWKPIIMSIALENQLVVQDEMIPWNESVVCGTKRFHDWKSFPPELKLDEILIHSSNVGIIQVSQRLFANRSHQFISHEIKRMGFLRNIPVDYPVQPYGMLYPEMWGPISVGALAEGYEVGVTLIQMAAFYCAVANGGYLVDPHFGSAILNPSDGHVVRELNYKPDIRIMSDSTSTFIRKAMIQCVKKGTGKKANLDYLGCQVAGKTATAKLLVDGSYASGKYRASFAGFLPADNPQMVILVSIEDPGAGAYYGGAIAAPLFHKIAKRILLECFNDIPLMEVLGC
ncbi:penicillin-binding protein 2 [bacterium]|nr:penicillin-binding protein 2 [candidate division CSSED10-310 bacterium]